MEIFTKLIEIVITENIKTIKLLDVSPDFTELYHSSRHKILS